MFHLSIVGGAAVDAVRCGAGKPADDPPADVAIAAVARRARGRRARGALLARSGRMACSWTSDDVDARKGAFRGRNRYAMFAYDRDMNVMPRYVCGFVDVLLRL